MRNRIKLRTRVHWFGQPIPSEHNTQASIPRQKPRDDNPFSPTRNVGSGTRSTVKHNRRGDLFVSDGGCAVGDLCPGDERASPAMVWGCCTGFRVGLTRDGPRSKKQNGKASDVLGWTYWMWIAAMERGGGAVEGL